MDLLNLLVIVIHWAFRIYYLLILANILLSWIPHNRGNAVIRFIYEMTEPYLRIFRRFIPVSPRFPIDFSPIIAIFVLYFIESILLKLILMVFY